MDHASPAFGKTAVAAWLIAKRKVNTLVLVHRQQLLDQWHERLAMFLGSSGSRMLPSRDYGDSIRFCIHWFAFHIRFP